MDGAAGLDWISVAGFRSLRRIDKLALRPLNVLIGANGSGKSNLVEVFSFLHAVGDGRMREYVRRSGGAARLLHFGPGTTSGLEFRVSFHEERHQYHLGLAAGQTDELYVATEAALFRDESKDVRLHEQPLSPANGEAGISDPDLTGVPRQIREELDGWRIHHFHDTSPSAPLRRTANLHDRHFLRADGGNLPAVLHSLRESHPASYAIIRNTVRLAVPFLQDFLLRPFGETGDAIRLQWTHRDSDLPFDGSALSDGTLRFIALATLFLQPRALRPNLILLDEPELGLHPMAIGLLADLVRAASTDSQVILSTQSATFLDYFEPEDLLVGERADGQASFRRIEAGALEVWLEDYSLGQLWEKNYLGGRPRSESRRRGSKPFAARRGAEPVTKP